MAQNVGVKIKKLKVINYGKYTGPWECGLKQRTDIFEVTLLVIYDFFF